MNQDQQIVTEDTDLDIVHGQIGNLKINWILHKNLFQHLGFSLKINNDQMFLYRFFYHTFKIMPEMLYMDDQIIIFFLNKFDKALLEGPKTREVDKLRTRFKRNIYFITKPFTLGDLIYNLFSRVQIYNVICILKENGINNSSKPVNYELKPKSLGNKESSVSIYVYVKSKDMPIALGKKGSYIHGVNKLLQDSLGDYRVYLRPNLENE